MDVLEQPLDSGRRTPAKIETETLQMTNLLNDLADAEALKLLRLDEVV